MTDKAVKREFSFTDREAGIVARCELGVGDLPRRLSLMLGATAAATVALCSCYYGIRRIRQEKKR